MCFWFFNCLLLPYMAHLNYFGWKFFTKFQLWLPTPKKQFSAKQSIFQNHKQYFWFIHWFQLPCMACLNFLISYHDSAVTQGDYIASTVQELATGQKKKHINTHIHSSQPLTHSNPRQDSTASSGGTCPIPLRTASKLWIIHEYF